MTDKQDMGVVTQADRDLRSAILTRIVEMLDRPCGNGDMPDNRNDELDAIIAAYRLASQADQGREMFEAGYMAMWSEAHVKGAIKLPELNDNALDRAWDIYLATHPQPSQKGEGDE